MRFSPFLFLMVLFLACNNEQQTTTIWRMSSSRGGGLDDALAPEKWDGEEEGKNQPPITAGKWPHERFNWRRTPGSI